MIQVFVTLVLCSCMKEKLWLITNEVPVGDIPQTKQSCSHESTLVPSSPIDNTTSITSLQADNITLTALLYNEIPATASLPVSNITSTVSFPVVNITSTPTASIYNITRLSPEVVDHTSFTTELANDIPTVTELVDNVTSITPSLIGTVTSKTTEFINDTSLTIPELSNHITSSTTEFFNNITSAILSSVRNTSSMSEIIESSTLKTAEVVNNINSTIELVFNTSAIPSSVDNITMPIAGFDSNNGLLITELLDHTELTTMIQPVNNIPSTISSPYNFSSPTEEIVNNVTVAVGTIIDNVTLITESVHNTMSTAESVNGITPMASSFNVLSTMEDFDNVTLTAIDVFNNTISTMESINNDDIINNIVDNITLTTIKDVKNTTIASSTSLPHNFSLSIEKTIYNTTSANESVNNITSVTPSLYNFSSTTEEIVNNVILPEGKTFDNITVMTESVHDIISTTELVNNLTSITSLFNFSSTPEKIIDSATLTTIKNFNNIQSTASMLDNDSLIPSLLPIGNIISPILPYRSLHSFGSVSNTPLITSLSSKYTQKNLKVYWNVPTFVCRRYGINFDDISRFGIIQNVNDTWQGQNMAILYDPGLFPALIKSSKGSVTVRNGGVPQKGDLQKHLEAFEQDVDSKIDENFSGVGIIDFEHWRPILHQNWAALDQYRKYSYALEKEENPHLNAEEIKQLASEKFEKYARIFMEKTIEMAKALRPGASWSYYGYPLCNNLTPKHKSTQCHPLFIRNNDDIQWLWDQENILTPSIYIPINLNREKRIGLINGQLNEAHRIARKTHSHPKILPYFWFKYRDRHNVFLSKDDLVRALTEFLAQSIDGFIIWGSSNDVNTKAKCQQVYNYINQVFGPLVNDIIINKRVWYHDIFKN